MQSKKFKTEIGGRELLVEIGKLAGQADGSVTVRYGDTVVLATCVVSDKPREGINYLPLMVNYEEKLYAAGKIKGSRFIKREGRPTDEAIITGRLIDRAIRPFFNSKIRNDIQIVITVLSFDGKNDPVLPGLIGASIAVLISGIPWNGPIAGVSVGQINSGDEQTNKDWILNPANGDRKNSLLNFVVVGNKTKINSSLRNEKAQSFGVKVNMIDGEAKEVSEKIILETLEWTGQYIKKLIDFQEEIIKELQPKKMELEILEPDPKILKEVKDFVADKLERGLYQSEKIDSMSEKSWFRTERMTEVNKLRQDLGDFIDGKYDGDEEKIQQAYDIFEQEIDKIVHKNVLEKEERPDGRKLDEVREISCEVGLLPRTHGSGLFNRGNTQALSVVTLGSPRAEQLLDQMELEGKKRFMHHYNFPPFSVGEAGPMRGPGRREIGHGSLAEKALVSLIPDEEKFPYTIRLVSEIFSSNGSSSMASVCGSTLALLDAGVPIKANAAGIAMGLMLDADENKHKILTDIQGPEDHYGDMDLKVAGTRKGITAIQMDVKVNGLSFEILEEALADAKKAREKILDKMETVIKIPRTKLSIYAPRVYTIHIDPKKIGTVIGPGGKMINKIIDETGAEIDIEEDGTIFITSPGKSETEGKQVDGAQKAIDWINNLTREVKVGEIFQGKVSKVTSFGAFIELLPGQDGLLHISELLPKDKKTKDIESLIHQGDIITVRVKEIDDLGRINLTLFKKGVRM